MRTNILIFIAVITFSFGCQKEEIILQPNKEINYRSGDGLTILGPRLTNPFTVQNVRAAYAELYNDGNILNVTHKYVRFLPSSEAQLRILVDNFSVLDDTPMDYEILYRGAYYHDAGWSETDFTWLYTVLPVDKSLPPGIQSEIIEELILIKPTTALYYRMYDRTGNGDLLQRGAGDCTTDCSNYPCCLDDNIPCADEPCNIDDDEIECYKGSPNWPDCLYDVDDPPSGGSGGSNPPNSCGCNNNVNPLKPSGKVSVEDTQLGDIGVKNIFMRAQNDVLGFSWSHTQTDENGCFRFEKAYTAKNISIKLLYNNERTWMRSWRGARVWNMILPMISRARTINKPFNNICLLFEDDNLNGESSFKKEEWAGCTAFNAIEEYNQLMPTFGLTLPSGRMEITITHHGSSAAAPMLSEHFEEQYLDDIVLIWLAVADPFAALVIAAIREGLPDIWFPYDLNEFSDDMKQTVFHELGHASHYTRVNGTDFWGTYRNHIIANGGYGDGNDPNSELVAVSEPFAETIGVTFADIIYGTSHSNGLPIRDRWIFELEEENLNDPANNWIPWGIYYDLSDNNGTNPAGVLDNVTDNISGYQINNMFTLLNGDVRTMTTLEERMLTILPAGASNIQVNSLFNEYGF